MVVPLTIRELPSHLVEKISAGEVVERPASIVKELIENSADAGARRIQIRVTEGGKSSVNVTDDGCGIPSDQLALAIHPHATSKIETFEDLAHVTSYGFRGEALSSIAAISKLDLLSRTHESPMGMHIRAEAGSVVLHEPYGMPPGTTVAASQLFFNTPARKKFLRSPSTELGHIETVLRRAAMGLPALEWYLENNGEIVLHFPEASDLSERLRQLYGKETTDKLVSICESRDGIDISGFVSSSHVSFARPTEIWFFVNGRPVKDRIMQSALMEGFRSALMERRYPLAVLHVTLPTTLVDVNVHPAKTEVRFADSQPIFQLIASSVSRSLTCAVAPMVTSRSTSEVTSEMPLGLLGPSSYSGSNFEFSVANTVTAHTPYAPYLTEQKALGPFASLHYRFTFDQTYLVCQNDEAMIVIDQHAAHERVLFEKLTSATREKKPHAQRLLLPLTMELNRLQEDRLKDLSSQLAEIGFEIEPFGERTFVIKAVPEMMGNHDPRPLLTDLCANGNAWADRRDDFYSQVACHSAVRAHDTLTQHEIQMLLSEMDGVDLASNCPHGRPTFLRFSVSDFERLFHRK